MRFTFSIFSLIPLLAFAAEPPLAIRNANVETLSAAGRLEGVTLVVRDGKIAAIGKDVAVPDNASVIDAAGGTILPGVIDPYFEVSVAAATADAGPRTVVVRGRPMQIPGGFGGRGAGGFTRVADNFYPYDAGFKPLPRVGLTRLNVVTNGMGQAAIVSVTPALPERMLQQPDGLAFVTVTNSTESLDQLRTRLSAASRGTRAGAGSPAAGTQLWVDVFNGKTPLVAECSNPAAVLHVLKATESYKNVRLVLFLGGDSVAETASALKDRKVTVILRPGLDLLPNTRDRFNPARHLNDAGVDFAFSLTARPPQAGAGGAAAAAAAGDDSTLSIDPDFPLFPVAIAVKTGVPRIKALEALAKKPATIIGIEKTHGTIEAGKAADLLLFTGDPLDPLSRLKRTIIDGRTVYAY